MGGSFNSAKMVVWVLHKDLECQEEKAQDVGGHATENQK